MRQVEALVSLAAIRSQIPTTSDDALLFNAPPGWTVMPEMLAGTPVPATAIPTLFPKPRGPAPTGYTWDAERGVWVDAAGKLREVKSSSTAAEKGLRADGATGVEGGQPRPEWVQRDAKGACVRRLDTRAQVEDVLEEEAAEAEDGKPWLGQLVGGWWEIRPRAVMPALTHVVNGLVDAGHIAVLPPERTGRSTVLYVARSRYFKGTPFPQSRRKRERLEPAPQEELSEFEQQRLRNIARNQELLKQLGLA